MKKIFKWTLFAVATLSLAACGISAQKTNSQQAKTEKAAKSSDQAYGSFKLIFFFLEKSCCS